LSLCDAQYRCQKLSKSNAHSWFSYNTKQLPEMGSFWRGVYVKCISIVLKCKCTIWIDIMGNIALLMWGHITHMLSNVMHNLSCVTHIPLLRQSEKHWYLNLYGSAISHNIILITLRLHLTIILTKMLH
jgi:hypothetical protein